MSIKNDIEFLGLDFKKEIIKLLIPFLFSILLTLIIIFFFNFIYVGFLPIVTVIIEIFFVLTHYSNKKKQFLDNLNEEFVAVLSYFELFISNNQNVYHAFESCKEYCSCYLKNLIEQLLHEIDSDKSVQPFINFANKFSTNIFESVMLSIYQMIDNGEDSKYLTQFDMIFNQISLDEKDKKMNRKNRDLDMTNSFPLIGAAFITVLLLVCIINLLGDYINVI